MSTRSSIRTDLARAAPTPPPESHHPAPLGPARPLGYPRADRDRRGRAAGRRPRVERGHPGVRVAGPDRRAAARASTSPRCSRRRRRHPDQPPPPRPRRSPSWTSGPRWPAAPSRARRRRPAGRPPATSGRRRGRLPGSADRPRRRQTEAGRRRRAGRPRRRAAEATSGLAAGQPVRRVRRDSPAGDEAPPDVDDTPPSPQQDDATPAPVAPGLLEPGDCAVKVSDSRCSEAAT